MKFEANKEFMGNLSLQLKHLAVHKTWNDLILQIKVDFTSAVDEHPLKVSNEAIVSYDNEDKYL